MFEKFFTDPSFDFETRTLLGGIHYGAGDIGEMLSAVASITDGDATSWVTQWRTLAGRIETTGEACLNAGHRVSARQAYCARRCTTPPPTCSWMGPSTPTRS